MKASFTSTEIKTFAEQCQDQHGKNFAAYKKAQITGRETIKAVKASNHTGLVMVVIVFVLPLIVLVCVG